MRILLIYRRPHERLEEALRKLVHSVSYNLWDIKQFLAVEVDAVIFETKQILKRKCKFLLLTWQLKKYGIPGVTWCADLPNFGVKIYVNRTPEEKKLTRRFMDLLGNQDVLGSPEKNLSPSASLIQSCSLFITADAGSMHTVLALGVPTLALIGADSPLRIGPYQVENAAYIYKKDEVCSADRCLNQRCPDNRCMQNIHPEEVFDMISDRFGLVLSQCCPNYLKG